MYRVDRREFEIGGIITPPENGYQAEGNLDNNGIIIENALEQLRPGEINIPRSAGLFVFPELSDAIRFQYRVTDSKIYKVQRTVDTILYHRGDMNFTELMNLMIENEVALEQMATHYWNKRRTFKPCLEILVNQVVVLDIVVNAIDRVAVRNEYYAASGNVEAMTSYRQMLNEL